MLMMCVFYCVDLVKFLYFASSAIFGVFGLFMLKRGIYGHRPGLRKAAFILFFILSGKAFLFDMRMVKQTLVCDMGFLFLPCSGGGMMLADFVGMGLFAVSAFVIYLFYCIYMPDRRAVRVQPDELSLRFWANLSLWCVIGMIVWLAVPWVGSLVVGEVPGIFLALPWYVFPLVNLGLLLNGFWKAESCDWEYRLEQKDKMRHLHNNWTARDTLWLNVFLYLIALAFSYVSHDVLSPREMAGG